MTKHFTDIDAAFARIRKDIEARRELARERTTTVDGLAYAIDPETRYEFNRFSEDEPATSSAFTGWMEEDPRWSTVGREVFGRLYTGDDLEELDEPQDWAADIHDIAAELPEWNELVDLCEGERDDAGYSAIAVTSAALKVWKAQAEQKEEERGDQGNGDQGDQGGFPGGASGGQGDQGEGEGNGPQGPGQGDQGGDQGEGQSEGEASNPGNREAPSDRALRAAMRDAIRDQSEKIQEMNAAIEALGWGAGEGSDAKMPSETRRRLADTLRKNRVLMRIVLQLGRMLRSSAHKRKADLHHVKETIVDVTCGDEVGRMLPAELAALVVPELELDFIRKVAERQALVYEMEGKEEAERGPVVVLLDRSGSMNGAAMEWAAALSIAIAVQATREGRSAEVIPFSGSCRRAIRFTKSNLPEALEAVAAISAGGGTSWSNALEQARRDISEEVTYKKADIAMITDGICAVHESWRADFNAWREEKGVATYTLILGTSEASIPQDGNSAPSAFSDDVYAVPDLNADAMEKAADLLRKVNRK